LSDDDVAALAELTVGRAEASRSTWTVWNLRAEADRLLREPPASVAPAGMRFTDVAERTRLLERVVDAAVRDWSVPVTVQPDLTEPAVLRRPDGTSVFVEHAAARHTSQTILDAEARLLDAAQTPTDGALPPAAVLTVLDRFDADTGTRLTRGNGPWSSRSALT
jgi:hypothetical protein